MALRKALAFGTLVASVVAACASRPPTASLAGPPPSTTSTTPTAAPRGPWWQNAVFYEVYPRSFQDTNGDGVGDLPGITSKLDYLADLGIDAIWITPFYPSPQVDFGYDISDYENVDPQFGTLADFDQLVAEAHKRGIRIVADLVLNHTSDKHPFFVSSRSSRRSPYRDFYIWRDPLRGSPADAPKPPNNWASIFEPSAWTFDAQTGQYYYHAFYTQQPDLNWRNPAVEQAMFKSVRFWLDRGVDAFRLDAIQSLHEDQLLRDDPLVPQQGAEHAADQTPWQKQIHRYNFDLPDNHALLQRLRTVTDGYPGDRILIGETYVPKADDLVAYYGPRNNELELPFNFLLFGVKKLDAAAFRAQVDATEQALAGRPTNYVLSNHDNARSWDHYGDGVHDEAIAKLLGLMLLSLRGAPFVYYGEEIGMVTTVPTTRDEVRDPVGRRYWPIDKGRDGERTPMQWDGRAQAGFTTGKPWLPVPPSASTRNVATEARDPRSLLNIYKRVIRMRRESNALRDGAYEAVEAGPQVFAYLRTNDREAFLVALNMSGETRSVPVAGIRDAHGALQVKLSTLGERTLVEQGSELSLAPYEGVVAECIRRSP